MIWRVWGNIYEDLVDARLLQNFLYVPDSCMAHSHNKIKAMKNKSLYHQSRHLSIRNVQKYEGVVKQIEGGMKRECQSFMRLVGPPPAQPAKPTLRHFADIIYDYRHRQNKTTAKGKDCHSSFFEDLHDLCGVVNGELPGPKIHHCWDPERQAPCHKNDEDLRCDVQGKCSSFLHSHADKDIGESRWTGTSENYKKSLMRRASHKIGTRAFYGHRRRRQSWRGRCGQGS